MLSEPYLNLWWLCEELFGSTENQEAFFWKILLFYQQGTNLLIIIFFFFLGDARGELV